jgi:hypothetical protein
MIQEILFHFLGHRCTSSDPPMDSETIKDNTPGHDSRGRLVISAIGYALRIRFPVEVENFSLFHSVRTGSGAHTAPYAMGSGGSFSGGR